MNKDSNGEQKKDRGKEKERWRESERQIYMKYNNK